MATYQKETALFKEGAISEIKDQIDETQQYFWVKSGTGSEAGAHITEKAREEFEFDPENGGGNVLITSTGMDVRNGTDVLATFGTETSIYTTSGTELAHFGYGPGNNSGGGTSNAPFYTLGIRTSGSTVGNYSVAEGYLTEASGYGTHAEGCSTKAVNTYAHAEGYHAEALSLAAHAEGGYTRAIDFYSHAEGYGTEANGWGGHAEGYNTITNGQYSHAEGYKTLTDYTGSHAQNIATIATRKGQTALGSFNVEDTSQTTTHPSGEALYGQYAVIVGNGTDDNSRSNALTVDWNGNVDIASGAKYRINGNPLSASDVGALPSSTTIPTTTSDLLNDSGFIAEDANGDISVTRNITAGGDITDGTGNILSSKADTSAIPTATSDLTNDSGFISEDANGDVSVTNDITCGGDITCSNVIASGTVSGKRETVYDNASGWTPSTSTGTTVDGKIANYSLVEVHLSDGSFGVCGLSWSNGTGTILGTLSYPWNDYIYVNSVNFRLTASGNNYTLIVPSAEQMPATYRIGTSVLKVTTVRKLTKIVGLVSTHE